MGLPQERIVFLRRAALLHDIGKLNVSNSILDKPNKLNDDEWQSVLGHPSITRRILERIGPFQEIALVAGEHHEKLDGSGYPGHLYARDLSLESRIPRRRRCFTALFQRTAPTATDCLSKRSLRS